MLWQILDHVSAVSGHGVDSFVGIIVFDSDSAIFDAGSRGINYVEIYDSVANLVAYVESDELRWEVDELSQVLASLNLVKVGACKVKVVQSCDWWSGDGSLKHILGLIYVTGCLIVVDTKSVQVGVDLNDTLNES